MSSFYDFNVTLYRDSLSTPWGFRLEGGRDFQAPLTIQRVFTGSPASGDLQRGDVLLSVQNRDASQLYHQEANDIIKHCGGSIQMSIRRGQLYSGSNTLPRMQPYRPASSMAFSSPPPMSRPLYQNNHNLNQNHLFSGEDPLTNYIRSRPIEKVRDPKPILSQTGSPIMPGGTPQMTGRSSIRRYKPTNTMPILAKLPTTHFEPRNSAFSPTLPPTTQSFFSTNNTALPYQEKRMVNQIQQSLSRAIHSPKYDYGSVSAYPAFQLANNQSKPAYADEYSRNAPEWREPLKRTGFNIYEEPQQQQYQQQQYQQQQPAVSHSYQQPENNQSNKPKVVNLQYNTPIGLYSKDNVRAELFKKVGNQGPEQQHFMPSSEF